MARPSTSLAGLNSKELSAAAALVLPLSRRVPCWHSLRSLCDLYSTWELVWTRHSGLPHVLMKRWLLKFREVHLLQHPPPPTVFSVQTDTPVLSTGDNKQVRWFLRERFKLKMVMLFLSTNFSLHMIQLKKLKC